MKFQTVFATPSHLSELTPLFDAYRMFYGQESDPHAAETFLRERLSNAEAVIFMAVDDVGRGLGFTLLYPSFSSVSLKRTWILHDLYVMPFARRHGVATALLERALQHAEETDAKELQLSTATGNVSAQKLYEQLGYVRDEDFFHYFLVIQSDD